MKNSNDQKYKPGLLSPLPLLRSSEISLQLFWGGWLQCCMMKFMNVFPEKLATSMAKFMNVSLKNFGLVAVLFLDNDIHPSLQILH